MTPSDRLLGQRGSVCEKMPAFLFAFWRGTDIMLDEGLAGPEPLANWHSGSQARD
jgi:hypothetical protein